MRDERVGTCRIICLHAKADRGDAGSDCSGCAHPRLCAAERAVHREQVSKPQGAQHAGSGHGRLRLDVQAWFRPLMRSGLVDALACCSCRRESRNIPERCRRARWPAGECSAPAVLLWADCAPKILLHRAYPRLDQRVRALEIGETLAGLMELGAELRHHFRIALPEVRVRAQVERRRRSRRSRRPRRGRHSW